MWASSSSASSILLPDWKLRNSCPRLTSRSWGREVRVVEDWRRSMAPSSSTRLLASTRQSLTTMEPPVRPPSWLIMEKRRSKPSLKATNFRVVSLDFVRVIRSRRISLRTDSSTISSSWERRSTSLFSPFGVEMTSDSNAWGRSEWIFVIRVAQDVRANVSFVTFMGS